MQARLAGAQVSLGKQEGPSSMGFLGAGVGGDMIPDTTRGIQRSL